MKENTDTPFDVERVAELIENHRVAETCREQRSIENEVLDATVWSEGDQPTTDLDTDELDQTELRAVYDALRETDASEEVRMMVRRKFLKDV
jgi:hypothetical protein